MCVAAALGHLHASAFSCCQELWGHRRGSGEGTLDEDSEPPPGHLASTILHHPNPHFTFFPRYPPSSLPPPSSYSSSPLVVTGWVGHLGGGGRGKVPLWLTAGRSGFCRHGRGGRTHARRHQVCECVSRGEKVHLLKCFHGHMGCASLQKRQNNSEAGNWNRWISWTFNDMISNAKDFKNK